ncbi:hypothetical protein DAEQUDRAFT_720653 [Daedalea quercina L-15889]|uniref:SH3 domain-containing protein n=1 Tax=Daedalea quercina L-15889 TaxID=1314783 RepID=A0A165U703_9APHY|nr:hypothetical protein DAEQUDRAFT_720653 [Daedalea quercina L-15889]
MVFASLNSREKDAFFSLLDEYFSSRPDLLNRPGQGIPDEAKANAVSAVHNAFSRTTPQQAASVVSGFKRAMPPPRPDASASAASSEPEMHSVGRVAAAAAAFGASGPPLPRPTPPRRGPSSEDSESSLNRLSTQKKFGDVDISSGKAMFSSLRNSTASKHAMPPQVAPPTPAAFSSRRADFPPPPARAPSTASSAPSNASPPPPPPPRPRVPEPEPEGEWAEALYAYTSDDPGDLTLEEGVRVLITERTSDDWWMGEIDGRRGLVPAAYVKIL